MRVQVAIDCADPHGLAAFYAAAFGYDVEQQHERIAALRQQGLIGEDDDGIIQIDGRLAFATAAGCSHPSGSLPRLLFQRVPESKTTKNRVHLDFGMGEDAARDATVEHLLSLGATRLWEGQQGPVHRWVTMADPEGNEFCVSD
jgi:hypothetical protein